MTSTEIEQIFQAKAKSQLLLKLASFGKIEDSIKHLVEKSCSVFQAENSFFALILEEGLQVQAQAKPADLVKNFNLNISPFKHLLEIKSCISGKEIYLPLSINQQLFAVLLLSYPDGAAKLSQAAQTELELFAQEVSVLISLKQQITDLLASNEKLLRKNQLKSQLISTISHELRTPMTNVLGFSELMKNQEIKAEDQERYAEEIYNSALRLSNLIDNFLDLSRIEEGHELEINHLEETELDWLCERAWSMLGAINQNHQINWQFAVNLPKLVLDSEAITRVLLNLFNNAIKYSGQSKEINCSIALIDGELVTSIEDQGMGIAKSELKTIFERFYRVDNKEAKHIGGTGLGLWISKKIIEAHGGRIWCESEPGKGASFKFALKPGAIENAQQEIILH
ncbi:MAG: ATP-binding protein [Candidatus Melainabacteria bacterium]|nr:ATP-binding protein [Candidatus Melainabacteria bacterium]